MAKCEKHNKQMIQQTQGYYIQVICTECEKEWNDSLRKQHFDELHKNGVCTVLGKECDW